MALAARNWNYLQLEHIMKRVTLTQSMAAER